MSEPTHADTTVDGLPRLRIHHFFVLNTVFAVVMSVWLGLGLWRLVRSVYPDARMPEFGSGMSLIFSVHSLSHSAYISIVLPGLAWRKRGIAFPSQPGHWMAIYLAVTWVYEIVAWGISFFPLQLLGFDPMLWVTMPMSLAFRCFVLALWGAAYLHEPTRFWKLGWAAMALKTLLGVCWTLLFLGTRCVQWLLETYWYRHYHWQFPFIDWGSYANFISLLLPNYLLLAFLLAATVSDLRQHHQRHWSHWLVVISTFLSTVVVTVYYHIAL